MMSHAVVSEAGVRLSARRGFETLGDAARGLEALLIIEAGGARIPRDHPALGRARSDLAEAEAVIRAGRTTPAALRSMAPSSGISTTTRAEMRAPTPGIEDRMARRRAIPSWASMRRSRYALDRPALVLEEGDHLPGRIRR